MSIRAHRVKKIELDGISFNCGQEELLMEFLEDGDIVDDRQEGCGYIEIPIYTMEEAISKANELELTEETIKTLKGDIEKVKKAGEHYITYQCY